MTTSKLLSPRYYHHPLSNWISFDVAIREGERSKHRRIAVAKTIITRKGATVSCFQVYEFSIRQYEKVPWHKPATIKTEKHRMWNWKWDWDPVCNRYIHPSWRFHEIALFSCSLLVMYIKQAERFFTCTLQYNLEMHNVSDKCKSNDQIICWYFQKSWFLSNSSIPSVDVQERICSGSCIFYLAISKRG